MNEAEVALVRVGLAKSAQQLPPGELRAARDVCQVWASGGPCSLTCAPRQASHCKVAGLWSPFLSKHALSCLCAHHPPGLLQGRLEHPSHDGLLPRWLCPRGAWHQPVWSRWSLSCTDESSSSLREAAAPLWVRDSCVPQRVLQSQADKAPHAGAGGGKSLAWILGTSLFCASQQGVH